MTHLEFYQIYFGRLCLCFFQYMIFVSNPVLYLRNMHVEGNRRAFLHAQYFNIFVDELYFVRMYEDQTYLT